MADLTVAPGATFHDEFAAAQTGLVGTIKVGIYQGDTVIQALTTAGINESAALGIYTATLTAPSVAGDDYIVVWSLDGSSDPEQLFTSSLVVTSTRAATIATGDLYVTVDELKEILELQGENFADAAIEIAVSSASRSCDGYKQTRFYPAAGTRYYTADRWDRSVRIDDLVSATVAVDRTGDSSFGEAWTEGTEFAFGPANAADLGRPFSRLNLIGTSGRRFPVYLNSIRITGTFGWAETPVDVKQAAIFIANRFLFHMREAPLGVIIAAANDAVAAARLGRIDPDAALLLDNLPGASKALLV